MAGGHRQKSLPTSNLGSKNCQNRRGLTICSPSRIIHGDDIETWLCRGAWGQSRFRLWDASETRCTLRDCMKWVTVIVLVFVIVLVAILFLSASPMLPSNILHRRLLCSTPMGTSMTDVRKFLVEKRLKINPNGELNGGIPYSWDKMKPHPKRVSSKCVYATLGRYTGIPFRVTVEVFWGFDDQSRLVDIWVRKDCDGL